MATLSLPYIPQELLNKNWRVGHKVDKTKINNAALCLKAFLSTMCGIHLHTQPPMKKVDCEVKCERKYTELVQAIRSKYPDAVALQQIDFVDSKKIKKLDGAGIYRLSQVVRKACVNSFNRLWDGCLDNGNVPSGRGYDWVRQRVLVMLYRETKKITDPMPANQGKCVCFDCLPSVIDCFV